MKRIFILLGTLFSITTVFSQNIVKAEYFLGPDPGPGNGVAITNFNQGGIVNLSFTISTSNLNSGFHSLSTRVADIDGKWSRYETRWFYLSTSTSNTTNITGAEFFIDADTVPGGGIPINIGNSGPLVNFSLAIPAGISPGFHSLGIRVKDEEGKWSIFEQRDFYIIPNPVNSSPVVAAEYFYDTDPGTGNATPLIVNPVGDIITPTFLITVPGSLTAGDHILAIRVKDQDGYWSFLAKDTITVGAVSNSITCPANVIINAPTGQCSTIVNNIDPVITPLGSSYTYALSGATTGTGTGSASGKLFNVGVTIVTYAFSNSPATSCSFTVTVNSSTTPSVTIDATPAIICPATPVTLTAHPVNGGENPYYQWKKNGVNIGDNSNIYQSNVWSNGDVVTVVMTSSMGCQYPATDTSNAITITLTPPFITPTVSITSSSTIICPGQEVTFTAAATNAGVPGYAWSVNGVYIPGSDSSTFKRSNLSHGDIVKCAVTASLTCVTDVTAISNEILISVVSEVTPEVNIIPSATTICPGTLVTFTAVPTNGGTTPLYQWQKNGINIPNAVNSTFQTSSLNNGDVIGVLMTSSLACTNSQTVISNGVTITVTSAGTPSVNISTPSTTVCSGSATTFTATPVNGGTSPTYQWMVNNINVGEGGITYETSSLVSGDVVKVVMTTSLACASSPTATSNSLAMTILPSSPAIVNIAASATTICAGASVTFNVTSVSPGAAYQWQLNGNNISGATGTTYQSSSLQNGDKIKVIMIPASPCATPSPAASNEIVLTVNADLTASVTINASATSICTGQMVTFTATPTNAGGNNVYEWILNNNAVGTNSPTYQNSGLTNGDKIKVTMTNWSACGVYSQPVSNTITMNVGAEVTPVLTMSASAASICAGTPVTFYASPISGAGSSPSYQWKLNGNNIPGATSATYQCSTLVNGDVIRAEMTSSLGCANPQTVLSHDSVTMTVSPVALTPSVSISASSTTICEGQTIIFTAVPVNGGPVPGYQWKLNGINVGDNNDTYSSNSLLNGDLITVEMSTSVTCASNPSVISEPITITLATEVCGNGLDDDCDGNVDENCAEGLPVVMVKTRPVKEGDAGYTILNVEVKLDQPATGPVTVNYATSDANATAGSDYDSANGVLTIPAGSAVGHIQLRIMGDVVSEHNESFWINFSNPVNATLGNDPRARIMIIDDDKGKPTSAANNNEVAMEQPPFKIPTVARRNQVWMIPQIGNYENEVLVINLQGQVMHRFINYKNQTPVGNIAVGLYFYRIRIIESSGQYKYYAGRLLITE